MPVPSLHAESSFHADERELCLKTQLQPSQGFFHEHKYSFDSMYRVNWQQNCCSLHRKWNTWVPSFRTLSHRSSPAPPRFPVCIPTPRFCHSFSLLPPCGQSPLSLRSSLLPPTSSSLCHLPFRPLPFLSQNLWVCSLSHFPRSIPVPLQSIIPCPFSLWLTKQIWLIAFATYWKPCITATMRFFFFFNRSNGKEKKPKHSFAHWELRKPKPQEFLKHQEMRYKFNKLPQTLSWHTSRKSPAHKGGKLTDDSISIFFALYNRCWKQKGCSSRNFFNKETTPKYSTLHTVLQTSLIFLFKKGKGESVIQKRRYTGAWDKIKLPDLCPRAFYKFLLVEKKELYVYPDWPREHLPSKL